MFIFQVTPEKPQKLACLSGKLLLHFLVSYTETCLNPPQSYALHFVSLSSTIGYAVICAKLFMVHNLATYKTISFDW
jgi:hypothetical protein